MAKEEGQPGVAVAEEQLRVASPGGETLAGEKPELAEEQVDWKARYEQEAAARAKAEGDARSLKGDIRRQAERDATIAELRDHVGVLSKNQMALLDAVEKGETEGLRGQFAQVEQQLGEARAATTFQRYYGSMWNNLAEAITGEDGKPVFDIEAARSRLGAEAQGLDDHQVVLLGAPELDQAREVWGRAAPQGERSPANARNAEGLVEALALAQKAARKAERQRFEAHVAEARKAGKREATAESLDLGSGREAGGGSPNYERIRDAYIANPYDPANSKAYNEMRREKGL